MISEKTVELNVTAELLNWLGYATGVVHTAIGPSQQQEGVLGYDVSVHGGSTAAALIQYKRAYIAGSDWTWHLNRTKSRDQHARLQLLQASGYPVFYAFPEFATVSSLVALRRRLLVNTFWYPPLSINPPGGPKGHHEVQFNSITGNWSVSSPDRVSLAPPLGIREVVEAMRSGERHQLAIEEFAAAINSIMRESAGEQPTGADDHDESGFYGQSLILRHASSVERGAGQSGVEADEA